MRKLTHDEAFARYDGAKTGYRYDAKGRITTAEDAPNGIWWIVRASGRRGMTATGLGCLAGSLERLAKLAKRGEWNKTGGN
jgi:hypothetical protein